MDIFSKALEAAVKSSQAPGAVACIGDRDRTLFCGAYGLSQIVPSREQASSETLYDLASLTKVVATTTAVLMLRNDGALDLDQPVAEVLPVPAFKHFTFRHCITHTAGLSPGISFYREVNTVNEVIQRVSLQDLKSTPGSRHVYSDLGFMILGKCVELIAGDSLDAFCARRIFAPLGMTQTRFRPPGEWVSKCASTEQCTWRGCVVRGVVHDEMAWAVGGVAGHAGLFSTGSDLGTFCRALYERRLFSESTLREVAKLGQVPTYPWQGLGWKIDPWSTGSEGFLPSRTAIGHTGWTGTSIWLDIESGQYAVLLGNTCHPSRDARDNRTFRKTFHKPLANFFFPSQINTHTGLDRLIREEFDLVKDKRLAVLTNSAAVDQLGRPLLDVLDLAQCNVRLIYTPEHGLKVSAEAGEKVGAQSKAPNGEARLVSLYGDQKRPDLAELSGIDLMVVDLPDIGSRYYTYMATMLSCMQACAEAGKPVLVLDRPNPLGGLVLEGPIARDYGKDVCCAPIPARHGMTLGELALHFRDTLCGARKPHVTVCSLDSWNPERVFSQCGLPWVAPSPNMPSAETALLYAGTCLFEGVNLNEGRGTETPFMLLGAPWLDAEAIVAAMDVQSCAGCRLEAVRYTPVSIPGKASKPTFMNEACNGVRISIEDASTLRSFTLAVALLAAIKRRHPGDLKFKPNFDILAGGSDLRERIERGQSAGDIVAAYRAELQAFDAKRPRLYADED